MRNLILLVFSILAAAGFSIHIRQQRGIMLDSFRESIEMLDNSISARHKGGKIFLEVSASFSQVRKVWKKLVFSNVYIISYHLEGDKLFLVVRPEGRRFLLLRGTVTSPAEGNGNCNYIHLT